MKEAGSNDGRITLAYRLVLGRLPSAKEHELARAFLVHSPLNEFCRALFNLNDFSFTRNEHETCEVVSAVMNPITHFLLSWGVANTLPNSTKRDRMLITVAGIAPDFDGLGIVPELLTRNSQRPLLWWTDYHHILGHNLAAAVVFAALAALLAHARLHAAFLVFITYNLHLLCDVIGARGPDGYQWPIPYLLPFSSSVQWTWQGQWALNAWQNIVITIAAIAATILLARRRGYSPLEIVSARADRAFVDTLRTRFPISTDRV